ncbi:symplekin [Trichonephila inaurata madagascariensis]|uniref:Symplekin n=1 Tax=Trichonephila inaurata madagascariensis TaxID=2747483 RepID=A0A8X6YXF4_9ARAC|nr:symplekin [Trichonephila inaurata madagascariensis]
MMYMYVCGPAPYGVLDNWDENEFPLSFSNFASFSCKRKMASRHSSSSRRDQNDKRYQASSSYSRSSKSDHVRNAPKKKLEWESSNRNSRQTAVDCRRSTAAQFFLEEKLQETVSSDRVAQTLRDASLSKDEKGTLKYLTTVQELIIDKEPMLLDNFLDEVISFQHHQNSNVRKFIIQFIENACRHDIQILPKVIGNLIILLGDRAACVQKKVIQVAIHLYALTIKWLCNVKNIDEIMEATWAGMTELKNNVFALLESDNEGVQAMVLKFMEYLIIMQTFKDKFFLGDFSLDKIPVILKIFRPRKLEEEAKEMFQRIVDLHGAAHVSSLNLMICMQVITNIARKRFEFFPRALQAFESLHANLPPTLSQSQVSSVRKSLKLHLLTLVRHPGAVEFYSRISIMLSDLGAAPQQISRCFPPIEISKKRPVSKDGEGSWYKKTKIEYDSTTSNTSFSFADPPKYKAKNTAIDITAEDLVSKLTPVNVADLVLVSMLGLPDELPVNFQSLYLPIAAAGTEIQVKHLARLLATQLTIAGLGKGVEEMKEAINNMRDYGSDDEESSTKQIETVVSQTFDSRPKKKALVLLPSGGPPPADSSRYTKRVDFASSVKPLKKEESDSLCKAAFSRILKAEQAIERAGASGMRTKILTSLATHIRGDIATDLQSHIMGNPRNRIELAFNWIYQEYSVHKGFENCVEGSFEMYEETIDRLISAIVDSDDEQTHILYSRFFTDAPCITEGMAFCLKHICADETDNKEALELAKCMTVYRPTKKLLFLRVIADLTLHENADIRTKAVNAAFALHGTGNMQSFIEAFALRSLKFLMSDAPSPSDFVYFKKHPPVKWTEELTKVCLHLYLSLLPLNHQLIHDLGTVYVETSADIKRTILRALETPVKGMSMASPELLRFVEKCPKGAETLVTRIIHILTDKAPPSAELVSRVRDLYRKRVPDVRFLIPIINGLTKREVISALPELIKLNPTVLKEVFHRLLGSNFSSPLTPAELLVSLHNIDTSKCNLKIIMKATSLCFEEKSVYTQVVLAMVIQQLMEQDPLPILLMRTVIQSLANYPHLLGFVTNILHRLIVKKIWTQKKIWEGFIKCCQRTKPQSFQVLLQLPAPQLQEVLDSCPDLRDPLCQHVGTFTDHQKAHIPQATLDVLTSFSPKSQQTKLLPDILAEKINEETGEPLPPGQDHP